MNHPLIVLSILLLMTVLVARSGRLHSNVASLLTSGQMTFSPPILGACGGSPLLFPSGKGTFDTWIAQYHTAVDIVVSAHLSERPMQCTATGSDLPSTPLLLLAGMLPPWQEPQKLLGLRESDMGAVLLEFLRVYECALRERETFLPIAVAQEAAPATTFSLGPHTTEMMREQTVIGRELTGDRNALHRTLLFLEGRDRLRPLATNMECLARASLDLRNTLGLAADASACMPRVWDARGSLRNLAQ
ncbi:hypothetical protein HYR82_03550 [Candidatus Peregrinibacteria bacterium]|nr:hypothetical protein [Candidatus Peregrinibacteria bacterium]